MATSFASYNCLTRMRMKQLHVKSNLSYRIVSYRIVFQTNGDVNARKNQSRLFVGNYVEYEGRGSRFGEREGWKDSDSSVPFSLS